MDWNKTEMTKAELEKKQREFMEEAMRMAKRSAHKPEPKIIPVEEKEEEPVQEIIEEPVAEEEICEEIIEEQPVVLPLDEASEELSTEAEPTEETVQEEETTYGVFDAEELIGAIESGEITGDGLKQAAEILREMTDKTEAMRKLLQEQERKMSEEKKSDDGSQIGLNSYIDRHNTGCRGCRNGKFNTH